MSNIAQLENELLAAIASAKDEAGLEAVRVAALGKNGSVTALLKTLGAMTPDERKVQGPAINGLKDRVTAAHRHGQGRACRQRARCPAQY